MRWVAAAIGARVRRYMPASATHLTSQDIATKTAAVGRMTDLRVRRVGFRSGTDAELTAMHAVESPIEAERRPDRVPQPLESYIAFARNLPSQFEDHTWLVETSDATPIGTGACWSNAAGDPRVMECDLFVRRDRRRDGIGSRLLALICDETASEGRSVLTWSTFDAVPAGDAFSARLGARVARINARASSGSPTSTGR